MKILFLENEPIASKLRVTFNDTSKYDVVDFSKVLSEISIEEIAKEIHDTHAGTDLFIINANVLVSGRCRTDFAGIELLKFIRLYRMNRHVILYSFMSREQIMQQSVRHSIIFSKGLTFYRLPDFIKEIKSDKFYKKIDEAVTTKAPDDLSDFFKAEYQLPDNRHFVANWWGVWRLWEIHKKRINLSTNEAKRIEDQHFSFSQNEMHSLQGKISEYMYINKQHKDDLSSIFSEDSFNILVKNLEKKMPKILYVDDQADIGWSYVFQQMIYGKEKKDLFFTLDKHLFEEGNISIITNAIKTILKEKSPHILILDLRLNPKIDYKVTKIEEISGIQILKELMDNFIPCPILITTASNKAVSFELVLEYGAHALWIKEGVDENLKWNQSVENYINFIRIIHRFRCNREYNIYRENNKMINALEDKQTKFWWEDETNPFWMETFWKDKIKSDIWSNKEINKDRVNKENILSVLKKTMILYSRFLAIRTLINEEDESGRLTKEFVNLIVIQCFKIIEIIYTVKNEDKDSFINVAEAIQTLVGKTFYFGLKNVLFDIRNLSAHYLEDRKINLKTLEDFFNQLRTHLWNFNIMYIGRLKGKKIISFFDYFPENLESNPIMVEISLPFYLIDDDIVIFQIDNNNIIRNISLYAREFGNYDKNSKNIPYMNKWWNNNFRNIQNRKEYLISNILSNYGNGSIFSTNNQHDTSNFIGKLEQSKIDRLISGEVIEVTIIEKDLEKIKARIEGKYITVFAKKNYLLSEEKNNTICVKKQQEILDSNEIRLANGLICNKNNNNIIKTIQMQYNIHYPLSNNMNS